jgi:hypothetical protein
VGGYKGLWNDAVSHDVCASRARTNLFIDIRAETYGLKDVEEMSILDSSSDKKPSKLSKHEWIKRMINYT